MWAANRGAVEAVRRLLAAGADPQARAEDGWTPQKAAEMLGDPDVLDALEQAR
jgi:ankyrin repeat protein